MKFDNRIIGYITTFENITRTSVKDCFFKDDELIFIVQPGQLGKAIGKNGSNVKLLAGKLKHKLRVIGFDIDPLRFVSNLLYPLKEFEIEMNDDKIVIKAEDRRIRGKIYGRERSNFKWINELLNEYFKGKELVIES